MGKEFTPETEQQTKNFKLLERLGKLYAPPKSKPDPFGRSSATPKQIKEILDKTHGLQK